MNVSRRSEGGELNDALAGKGQPLEVRFVEADVLALSVLVTPSGLLPLAGGGPARLLEAAPALLVKEMKSNVPALGGRVQLDRDAHHPKAYDATPDGPWHDLTSWADLEV